MAVSKVTDASRRRVVFGINAVVQGLLAVVLLVAVVWLAGRFRWQFDTTKTGVNSLSPRTRQLLTHLDENVRITAVFPEPDKRNTLALKHRQQIRDLLDLYEAANRARVSTYTLDPTTQKAETDKLLKHLAELPAYKDEAKPHEEALGKFPALDEKIRGLVAADGVKLEELVRLETKLAQDRNLAIVRLNLRTAEQEARDLLGNVQELSKGDIPRYGEAIRQVRDYLTKARDTLNFLSTDTVALPNLTPEIKTFFQEAAGRYKPVLTEINDVLTSIKDLKEVKLEEIYSGLTRWRTGPPVLVENAREGRLLQNWDVWPAISDPGAPLPPDGDDREFAGETAISSAILQLVQKTKTAVVFVRYGGQSPIKPDFSRMNMMMQQMPRAPCQVLNQLLEKANFVTEDWDVQQQKEPPQVKDAARTVYVVLPPEPPPRPNPMQPSPQAGMTPEDRKIVLDAVQAAGAALFLAGWEPPQSPLPMAMGTYEYRDYLKNAWGVDVEANYLAWEFSPNPDKPGWWVPRTQFALLTTDRAVRFTDHPIAKQLQTARAGFNFTVPLKIIATGTQPAGVKVEAIAEVRPSQDVWAFDDVRRLEEQWKQNQGLKPEAADLRAPFPIAVAAMDAAGHKAVIFDSVQFAEDQLAQANGLQQVGNAYVLGPLYPANSDLFINALHWLTGEADRIAAGPQRGDMPRLSRLTEAWSTRLPWFLVGLWPALALVVGVGVYLVRRR